MIGGVPLRPEAERDLEGHASFLGGKSAGLDDRFLDAVIQSVRQIASMPGLGSPYESSRPELAGLRIRPIVGFENYLIFYRTVGAGVEIFRVLHGSRDVERALASDS
jgi:toxin ParE1/3/4